LRGGTGGRIYCPLHKQMMKKMMMLLLLMLMLMLRDEEQKEKRQEALPSSPTTCMHGTGEMHRTEMQIICIFVSTLDAYNLHNLMTKQDMVEQGRVFHVDCTASSFMQS
jgi:hypothetical protein